MGCGNDGDGCPLQQHTERNIGIFTCHRNLRLEFQSRLKV